MANGSIHGPPIISFDKFDPVGSYQEGRKISRQNALEKEFSGGFPTGPDGQPDYAAMANTVARYGDIGTAIKLGALAQEQRKLGLSEQASRDFQGSISGMTGGQSGGNIPPSTSRGAGFTGTQSGRQYVGGVGIYDNDEPSPLDPPSGRERDLAVRTIHAEAGREPQVGKEGVANVIRTRAVSGQYGGDTAGGVITKPHAFEPVNTAEGRARMASISPGDPNYESAARALDSAYFGNDPTGAATHFYSPKGQEALGRPAPSWAAGQPQAVIGGHQFYSPDAPTDVSARQRQSPAPQQEAPGVPTSPAQNPAADQIPVLVRAMAHPHLPAGQRELAKTLLTKALDDAKLTDEQKEYVWHKAQGGTETFTEWKKDLKKAGATNVTVNSGEKSYDQGIGKAYSDQFIEHQKAGRSADTEIGTLRILDALTRRPDFYSGAGGNLVLTGNKALVALGVKDAKAASASEVFEALSNQTILDAAGGSLGNQISNADREFIQRTTATLSNTPEGNRELIGVRRKLAERKKQVAELARNYARDHGGRIDSRFDDELAKWTEANPLFSDTAQAQPGAQQPANNPAAIKQKYGLD